MGLISRRFRSCMFGIAILVVLNYSSLVVAADDAVIGQKITDFAAKVTSVTYLENKSVINLQTFGDVGPYGTVGVTATFSRPVDGDGSTGPYSSQGISFRKDDSVERISSQVV